jgi:ribonuclease HI
MSELIKKIKAELYTDGGARGNPGPAGIGGVLKIKKRVPVEFSEYIGKTTNNQAEYRALVRGLKLANENGVSELICYLDSELIVKQLRGDYRVRDAGLKILFAEAQRMVALFEEVIFEHVVRAKNKRADKLVNMALDREGF